MGVSDEVSPMSTLFASRPDGLNELPFAGAAITDLERLTRRESGKLRALRGFLDWLSTPPLGARLQTIRDMEAMGSRRIRIIMERPFTFAVEVQDLLVRVMIRNLPEPTPVVLHIDELVIA
jgi:hypothetical protein